MTCEHYERPPACEQCPYDNPEDCGRYRLKEVIKKREEIKSKLTGILSE